MTKQMLIDAAHPEEVRVCVLENGKVEDFDFELSSRKPLRGNIYLARVTRVEPSLQAAFVEYGGNRHGFLAFNEIHPDYYQIPVSDRRLLQEAEAEEAQLAAQLELEQRGDDRAASEDDFDDNGGAGDDESVYDGDEESAEEEDSDISAAEQADDEEDTDAAQAADEAGDDEESSEVESDDNNDAAALNAARPRKVSRDADLDDSEEEDDGGEEEQAKSEDESSAQESDEAGAEEGEEKKPARKARRGKRNDRRNELLERYKEARRKRARLLRNYKIQEVIKRRQILLVQVVKEERGNKGAALTTYLSLAGRYCVLMPNTARGGGISRKIPSPADRKRLRHVVGGLDVPQGMGLIIRTAGAKRTKAEIKRDYDYLTRLWETIRSLTLSSIAPCLIYEEASLIKRAIRDLYDKDIKTVLVEGEAGYREAKDFMKMLMPSHAKNVQPFKDKTPLFLKHGAENQIDAMYNPTVRLKSGGYLVIHQTEALVAIDVNSGKSTRERNIELTALKTNIEAAREAARQCRLRDLAGLVVIDFIDMMENKNNRAVEKALKEALKSDRARIQVGRISNFGLLEMSRQRRRSSLVEGTTHACPTCAGAGIIRSNEMAALRILRAVEGEALSGRAAVISVKTSLDVSLYILNQKRDWLKRIEDAYALSIELTADAEKAGDQYEIEKRGAPRELPEAAAVVRPDQPGVSIPAEPNSEDTVEAEPVEAGGKKKRRRRRRRRDESAAPEEATASAGADVESGEPVQAGAESAESDEDQSAKKRRRRGRRGGRRNRRKDEARVDGAESENDEASPADEQPDYESTPDATPASEAPPVVAEPAPEPTTSEDEPEDIEPEPREEIAAAAEGPANGHEIAAAPAIEENEDITPDASSEISTEEPDASDEPKPSRRGWWQRALGG